MKICDKFNNLFSYNKYYEMSYEDLENEIKKYGIGDFSEDAILRRNRIEQLIAKDNATMFKKSLIISLITLVIAFTSLVVSGIAIFFKLVN
jgi:hypothetical protein